MTAATVANLKACFASTLGLCESLTEDEWATQSLCPAWTVHGVMSHLAGIEHVMTGWRPNGDAPAPFDKIGAFVKESKQLSGAELAARFREILTKREPELDALTADDLAATSWTPIGIHTYGRFMEVRVFDFWVHEQDARVPLNRPGHLDGDAARMSLDEVRGSFGYIAGKKVGVPDGKGVTAHLTGPIRADLSAIVDGRAKFVESLAHPDAEITTDFLTFMLLACGRIDPEQQLRDGKVTLGGDPALAHQLATNLRFTF